MKKKSPNEGAADMNAYEIGLQRERGSRSIHWRPSILSWQWFELNWSEKERGKRDCCTRPSLLEWRTSENEIDEGWWGLYNS